MDPELKKYLGQIFETLKHQQEILIELYRSISVLETALRQNQSFADTHDWVKLHMTEGEAARRQRDTLALIETVLGIIRGGGRLG